MNNHVEYREGHLVIPWVRLQDTIGKLKPQKHGSVLK